MKLSHLYRNGSSRVSIGSGLGLLTKLIQWLLRRKMYPMGRIRLVWHLKDLDKLAWWPSRRPKGDATCPSNRRRKSLMSGALSCVTKTKWSRSIGRMNLLNNVNYSRLSSLTLTSRDLNVNRISKLRKSVTAQKTITWSKSRLSKTGSVTLSKKENALKSAIMSFRKHRNLCRRTNASEQIQRTEKKYIVSRPVSDTRTSWNKRQKSRTRSVSNKSMTNVPTPTIFYVKTDCVRKSSRGPSRKTKCLPIRRAENSSSTTSPAPNTSWN